ncbi:MAG TPA: ABC transporter ATP-binding protein [Dehalococcoidia bacterium]|nr:ABC transporter ATP-binding protein [Dehalococcoidia bacterium]
MALLEVKDLEASYGPVRALHGVSFEVNAGDVVSILGANGAGKTTTLRALCGMVEARGEIIMDGNNVRHWPTEKIARRGGVAHVPEGRGTFTEMTVDENLRVASFASGHSKDLRPDLERVYGYFPALAGRRAQIAGTLSGGEQQMLAIGRALMTHPRILLLDEPSQGLAPLITRNIFEILASLNKEEHVTMLIVEQNAAIALNIASSAYVLEAGRIVLSGTSERLRNDESVRKAYLGY